MRRPPPHHKNTRPEHAARASRTDLRGGYGEGQQLAQQDPTGDGGPDDELAATVSAGGTGPVVQRLTELE